MSPRSRKRGGNRTRKPAPQDRRRSAAKNGSAAPADRATGGQAGSGPRLAPRGSDVGFWGSSGALPADPPDVRISDEPSAVARSLGAPPLAGHERIAAHYFTAVYDRAVVLAGALAAAGGLVTQRELEEELDDRDEGDARR